jgi:Flp pilus assembly pilin Flp
MAEYLIIVIIVAILVIVAIRYFGGGIYGQFENATEQVNTAGGDVSVTIASSSAPSRSADSDGSNDVDVREADSGQTGHDKFSKNKSSGSGGVDAKVAKLRADAIGDDDDIGVNELKIDWKTLGTIALIICAIGFYFVFRKPRAEKKKLKKKKKQKKLRFSLKRNQDGQALVEFAISAITFLFVILGVIQLAMVLNAYTLVRYAAYNSARAGIVHAGNQTEMENAMYEAARVSLLAIFPRHGRADHIRGLTENYLAAKETDRDSSLTYFGEPITDVKVIDNNGLSAGSVVTFDDPVDADKSLITVQVVHHYELVIPLVNRILFYVFTKIKSGEGYGGETVDRIAALTDKSRRSGDFKDIEYRIPLVAHYTMRLQSDYRVP